MENKTSKEILIPSYEDIIEAHKRIGNYLHRTPILTSKNLNEIAKCSLFFKCENFQKTGSFKARGAMNAVLSLPKDKLTNGVATHSSGNHAQALAFAAKIVGTKATIVMPRTAPKPKINSVASLNAEIIFCEPTLKSREETLSEVVEKTGAVVIHPYDNPFVIAGQGTCVKELFEDGYELDFILAPVGGGGLLSGTSISTKFLSKNTKIFGVEPEGANDAYKSFRDNKIYPSVNPQTIADGLLTSLSERTFKIIKHNVDDIITVSEEMILQAMFLIFERLKIVVEPSGAVPFAGVLQHNSIFEKKKVGIILSGGNVDLSKLPFH
jgi:threonine dehydratase